MSVQDSVSPSRPTSGGRLASLLGLALLVAIATAGVFGALYYKLVHQPAQDYQKTAQEVMLRVTHLNQTVVNGLDRTKFKSSDNDALPLGPVDASKVIDPPTLFFSYIADGKTAEAAEAWKPLMEHLEKATGKKVEYAPFDDVEAELKALQEGKLHVAGLNTGGTPVAVNLCGFRPVVKVPGASGNGAHQMEIIVPADSSIKTIQDLRDHEITMTGPDSSSGYRAPLVLLKEQGLLAGTDYTIRYSGGHEQSIAGIVSHQFAAAPVANDMLARALAAGTLKPNQYRSIYKTASFPNAGIGYVCTLTPELQEKIKTALLDFDAKGTKLESYFPTGSTSMKFIPVGSFKEDWALVRTTDDAIGYQYKLK